MFDVDVAAVVVVVDVDVVVKVKWVPTFSIQCLLDAAIAVPATAPTLLETPYERSRSSATTTTGLAQTSRSSPVRQHCRVRENCDFVKGKWGIGGPGEDMWRGWVAGKRDEPASQ